MIIDKYVKIPTKGCRKIKQFSDMGYDTSGDFITLKVTDLNIGSRQVVCVECDFCNKIVYITYKEYLRNISIGNKYACNKHCGSLKAKVSNLNKWGVEYPMMLDEIQNKCRSTNLDKYGVEFLQQSTELKDKSKNTLINKYGVDHYSKTDDYKQKVKKSNIDKYGVEHYSKTDEFINDVKRTSMDKYGVDNYSKTDECRERVIKSNINKYGVEHYCKTDEFKERVIKSNINKYGVDNPMKSEIIRKDRFDVTMDDNYIKYVTNGISLFKCQYGHEFEIKSDNYYHRNKSNITLCTICYPISDQKSIKEKDLYNFIKEVYSGEIIQSHRDGLEIDIFLPDLGLGFEFNGLYWHSDKFKESGYHLNKSNYFKDKGIRIIHIWEDDWVYKSSIIKSQILNLLKKNEKIFARKCVVMEIDSKTTRKFMDDNHIQGKSNSVKRFGLCYNDELVSVMTFDNFEGRKKMEDGGWNLSRFCNKINTNVIGGASKLLSYFIKTYNPSRIISYADKDWSVGSLYQTLGFENIGGNGPDYKYIVDGKRVHKSRYRKSKLKTELTESKQMEVNGFNKIWDCGKIKFEKIIL